MSDTDKSNDAIKGDRDAEATVDPAAEAAPVEVKGTSEPADSQHSPVTEAFPAVSDGKAATPDSTTPNPGNQTTPDAQPLSFEKGPAPEQGTAPQPNTPQYGAPQYNVPQYGAPPQYGTPPPYMPPPPPHYPSAAPPAPPKPKTMEVAFAHLFFLGLFGGHKFYMGQKKLGEIYLIVGIIFFVFMGLPIIATFFGFFIFIGLLANLYVDIRTMREQLERSERGEEFTFDTQVEFFSKVFGSK